MQRNYAGRPNVEGADRFIPLVPRAVTRLPYVEVKLRKLAHSHTRHLQLLQLSTDCRERLSSLAGINPRSILPTSKIPLQSLTFSPQACNPQHKQHVFLQEDVGQVRRPDGRQREEKRREAR